VFLISLVEPDQATEMNQEIIKDFETLLDNNRIPKVSELRMGMIANYAMGGRYREEAGTYVHTRVSGKTLARMAFADAESMYNGDPACAVKLRPPGKALEGGGLLAGAGLYATRALKAGDVITEFEINAHISAIPKEGASHLFVDPRISSKVSHLAQEDIEQESLSVRIEQHTTAFFLPLSMHTNPYKLMAYANDSMPYPPEEVTDRSALVVAYAEGGGSRANAVSQSVYGFVVNLVASKDIDLGEEVLYHWGARHWDELYRLRRKGMRLRLHGTISDDEASSKAEAPPQRIDSRHELGVPFSV
jgi:hypothetical protein